MTSSNEMIILHRAIFFLYFEFIFHSFAGKNAILNEMIRNCIHLFSFLTIFYSLAIFVISSCKSNGPKCAHCSASLYFIIIHLMIRKQNLFLLNLVCGLQWLSLVWFDLQHTRAKHTLSSLDAELHINYIENRIEKWAYLNCVVFTSWLLVC